MKKIIILLLAFCTWETKAQTHQFENKPYIAVTGVSQLEFKPDLIHITFVAKEYRTNNKPMSLNEIHVDIQSVLKHFGIPSSNLEVADFYGKRWISKRQIKDLDQVKKYSLKITEMDKLDLILDKLDSVNVQEIYLEKMSHTKMVEYEEKVRIDAVAAAKKKALQMTQTLGQTLGKAFEIIDMDFKESREFFQQNISYGKYDYYSGEYQKSKVSYNQDSNINFKNIILEYEVSIKFELL